MLLSAHALPWAQEGRRAKWAASEASQGAARRVEGAASEATSQAATPFLATGGERQGDSVPAEAAAATAARSGTSQGKEE